MGDYPALLFECEYGGDVGQGGEDVPRHSPQSAGSRRERERKEKEKEKEKEREKDEEKEEVQLTTAT
jgi:hypothetical protein